jgi:nucleoside-diphosphate-sugar epimerase
MITVLGASGFIGSQLMRRLREGSIEYLAPARDEKLTGRNLGDVIYCIGLTADFRSKPFETVEAHVCKLKEILQHCRFDSLLYLSSTRIYGTHLKMASEEAALQFSPLSGDDLYNISKVLGEALALASGKRTRVARLSNVYGGDFDSDNFLASVLKESLARCKVVLHTSLDSEKDYVSINDVADGLLRIATRGKQRIYNLASGRNVSHRELMERLAVLTGCRIEVAPGAVRSAFPPISIARMRDEFGFNPSSVLDDLSQLIESYKEQKGSRG